jgi:O-6-methylguanine DNA methyltransferase
MTPGIHAPDILSGVTLARIDSPVGTLLAVADDDAIRALEFVKEDGPVRQLEALQAVLGPLVRGEHPLLERLRAQLAEYFEGRRREFDLPLRFSGTPFQERVWNELLKIPYGEVRSYLQIARDLGDAKAVRAVGGANGSNPISILVPCHRVIGADGSTVGYGGGIERKEWLLALERGERQLF